MKRSWHIWIAFALCLAVVLAAMGWVSLAALRADRAESLARAQAALEENIRLALWRMDSSLAPLLAQESARPYFAYRTLVPLDFANGRAFNRDAGSRLAPGSKTEVPTDPGSQMLVASALLREVSPYILVHFQFEPDGRLTSPRVPEDGNFELAVPDQISPDLTRRAKEQLARVEQLVDRPTLMARLPANTPERVSVVLPPPVQPNPPQYNNAPSQFLAQQSDDSQGQQSLRSQYEFQQRNRAIQQQANTAVMNQAANSWNDLAWTATDVSGVLMTPLWIDGSLILARRVTAGGREYVQGCQLDWPAIRGDLLRTVEDLVPGARLEPVADSVDPDAAARMLAALPVRLMPGPTALSVDGALSPIRVSLAMAWVCVLLAAGAVAMLLLGVMRLSERRGAFVSAVTHELRTPLCTFRMYSEMLADGMVPEADRPGYLATLQAEASRLTHLVENVLSYARLERGRAGGRMEEVPAEKLVDGVENRLADRARQADMELVVDRDPPACDAVVRTNPSAVEQILFNLVDNACKYAAEATDRRIHLDLRHDDGQVQLRVRDHGPGIAPAASRRLFRSFSKSAGEAANSAPGIGLGLALSYRLARDMGGRLRLEANGGEGASFVLTLPGA